MLFRSACRWRLLSVELAVLAIVALFVCTPDLSAQLTGLSGGNQGKAGGSLEIVLPFDGENVVDLYLYEAGYHSFVNGRYRPGGNWNNQEQLTIEGGILADTIRIHGFMSDDDLSINVLCRSGDDQVINYSNVVLVANGGSGNDELIGGSSHDRLFGGDDNDSLSGGSGNDWLLGGFGFDQIDGGVGNDIVCGNGTYEPGLPIVGSIAFQMRGYPDGEADLLSGGPGDDTYEGTRYYLFNQQQNHVQLIEQDVVLDFSANDVYTIAILLLFF